MRLLAAAGLSLVLFAGTALPAAAAEAFEPTDRFFVNDFADVLSAGPDGPSHSPIGAAGGSAFRCSRDGLASFDSAFDRMRSRGRSIYCFGGAVFLFFSH